MSSPQRIAITMAMVIARTACCDEPTPTDNEQADWALREEMYQRHQALPKLIKGGAISPVWMADGSSFLYAEGGPANTIVYEVDPQAKTKEPFLDTKRLRNAVQTALGHALSYQGVPFEIFNLIDDEQIQFCIDGESFELELDSYAISSSLLPCPELPASPSLPTNRRPDAPSRSSGSDVASPDGRWEAFIRNDDIWLRSMEHELSVQLTSDGTEDHSWTISSRQGPGAQWSPNSLMLAAKKVDRRGVPQVPIVQWLGPAEKVNWISMRRAGGRWPKHELYVIDILTKQRIQIDLGEPPKLATEQPRLTVLGWRHDGSEVFFLNNSRDFKTIELQAADPQSETSRTVLRETTKTFFPYWKIGGCFTLLDDDKQFIWRSQRDGWSHFYLYDLQGNLIRQLTGGPFSVINIVDVDELAGWIYFTAHSDVTRPYDTHLCRVDFSGQRFTQLTEATGEHQLAMSPSKQFFIDTHSTIDRPPTVELRRADGTKLQVLTTANIDALTSIGWKPPEAFQVKSLDGKSDLHGVLYKPFEFDPQKKYPVLEGIYGGPQLTVTPRKFITDKWEAMSAQALTHLGFIVFLVDVPGTPERSKAFLDAGYGKRGMHEIPEHVNVLKQLAATRPYMDLSRVGIFGHSFGGYTTLRAVLLAPDIYHAAVSSAPLADLDDNVSEYYLDSPQSNKQAYDLAANTTLASNLQGKLMLVHGTADTGVPFSATMKMVDALVRAEKQFELIVLPGQDHMFTGIGDKYYWQARKRFLVEHLKP